MQRSARPEPNVPAAGLADPAPPRWLDRLVAWRIPWLVLLGALALTGLAWFQTSRSVAEDAESRFALRVEQLQHQLDDHIKVYVQVARSAAALYTAFPEVRLKKNGSGSSTASTSTSAIPACRASPSPASSSRRPRRT